MSAGRLLLLIVFPAVAGLWVHLSVDCAPTTPALADGTCQVDLDELLDNPPVGASNMWGQHTPRRAESPEPADGEVEPPHAALSLPQNTFVDRHASVIGKVEIGKQVFVAPFASLRAGTEFPVHLGARSNVQDGAVVHALNASPESHYEVEGRKFGVYLGERVSISAQAQIHGPAWIENDVYVGMQSLVYRSRIGRGCVIEPAAKIIGVEIPAGRYVSAGSIIRAQAVADALPQITSSYGLREINRASVHLNTQLAQSSGSHAAAAPGEPNESD